MQVAPAKKPATATAPAKPAAPPLKKVIVGRVVRTEEDSFDDAAPAKKQDAAPAFDLSALDPAKVRLLFACAVTSFLARNLHVLL